MHEIEAGVGKWQVGVAVELGIRGEDWAGRGIAVCFVFKLLLPLSLGMGIPTHTYIGDMDILGHLNE